MNWAALFEDIFKAVPFCLCHQTQRDTVIFLRWQKSWASSLRSRHLNFGELWVRGIARPPPWREIKKSVLSSPTNTMQRAATWLRQFFFLSRCEDHAACQSVIACPEYPFLIMAQLMREDRIHKNYTSPAFTGLSKETQHVGSITALIKLQMWLRDICPTWQFILCNRPPKVTWPDLFWVLVFFFFFLYWSNRIYGASSFCIASVTLLARAEKKLQLPTFAACMLSSMLISSHQICFLNYLSHPPCIASP